MLKFNGILEPRTGNDVLVARIVATAADATTPVRIMNLDDQPLLVREGKLVGDFHSLDPTSEPLVRGTYELLGEFNTKEDTDPWPRTQEESQTGSTLPSVDLLGCELDEEQLNHLKDCLRQNSDVFSKTTNDIGLAHLVTHTIDTGPVAPIKQKPRRLPFYERDTVFGQVGDMSQDIIVENCTGPWSSPVVLVKKKNGDLRFCVDYRKLNAVTDECSQPSEDR
ncbi:uncharacterized protein LOC135484814 [Lineus longissimus]|uniref:uncharacterized protein LOC135484814 n=1 Tax=Lineus longissimus TaxID=88925 RepID=UPI00315CE6F1